MRPFKIVTFSLLSRGVIFTMLNMGHIGWVFVSTSVAFHVSEIIYDLVKRK